MFSKKDLELLKEKGISEQQIENQLNYFETGFPYLKIEKVASIGSGFLQLIMPILKQNSNA